MYQIDKKKCTGCRACVNACPVDAITIIGGKAEINKDVCIECGRCVQVCAFDAIYSEVRQPQDFALQQENRLTGFNVGRGRGLGRGMGRGKGRGLARGPRNGRGGGGRSGGRRW